MPTPKKFFPSQKENEEVFLLLRKHWFVYVPIFLIGLFMLLPLIGVSLYSLNYSQNTIPNLAYYLVILGSSYLLFILALLLFGFIDYYLDVDIITNQRIVDIEQNGFFRRKISELSLEQIEDVSAQVNGFFPTLLHFGNVTIQTAGQRENFVFSSIAHPYRISKIIADLHSASVNRRHLKRINRKEEELVLNGLAKDQDIIRKVNKKS